MIVSYKYRIHNNQDLNIQMKDVNIKKLKCISCKKEIPRDLNASINIKMVGSDHCSSENKTNSLASHV